MNIDDWIGTEISEEIIEQATQWVARLDADQEQIDLACESSLSATADTQALFYAWLDQAPVNQVAFAQVSELWAKTSCLKHMEHLLEPSQILTFPDRFKQHLQPSSKTTLSNTPLLQEQTIEVAAPAWTYHVVIGTIAVGFLASFLPIPLL